MDNNDPIFQASVDTLMKALDETPRIDWRDAVVVTLSAAYKAGMAKGLRSGLTAKTPANEPGELEEGLAAMAGEDRVLDKKPSPDDQLEDEGYKFINRLARQFGLLQRSTGFQPEDMTLAYLPSADGKPSTNNFVISIKKER